jgi:SAM-dependent methyltransferase
MIQPEFDVVVCQFGVMFFPDKQKGFREALRVLRPGGHLLFNVWDSLESNSNGPLRIAARTNCPILGREPVSLLSPPYHDETTIRSDLGAVGFADIQVEREKEPSRAGSAGEAAIIVCQGSMLRAAIEAHDKGSLDEITGRRWRAPPKRFW